MAASAVYWTIGGAAFLVIGFLLAPLLPRRAGQRIGLRLIEGAFAGFVKVLSLFGIATCEFIGFEALHELRGGYILAPNHPAIWDAVFIIAKVGGLTCVLKSSLLRHPLLSGGARIARFIPNEPPAEMVRRSVRALSDGERLLLFPEGTRTRKHEVLLNPFRGGVAIIAKRAQVPVVPLFVQTDDDYGMKGRPLWQAPDRKVHIRMTLGQPLLCGPAESTNEFLGRLRSHFTSALSASPID